MYHVRIEILEIVIKILFYETSYRRVLYLINTTSKRIRTMLIRKWIISKVLIVVGYCTNLWTSVSDVTVYLRGSLWKFLITAVKACCSQTKLHVKRLLNKVGEQCLDVVYADRSKKKKTSMSHMIMQVNYRRREWYETLDRCFCC